MRQTGSPRSDVRLLAGIAAEIERHLHSGGAGSTALTALERLGLAVVVTVEAERGPAPLKVKLPERIPNVPEWSPEDEEVLRSLGIAGGTEGTDGVSKSKPGRRQPR